MNKMTPRMMLSVLLVPVIFFSACTKKPSSNHNDIARVGDGIFSNRPQATDRTLLLIKLQKQPLMSALVTEKGHTKVNSELVKEINNEQEKIIKNLSLLSPEIKVLYRYRMLLNALAIVVPGSLVEKIKGITNVAYVESAGNFSRPKVMYASASVATGIKDRNSVKFIGGEEAHKKNIRGQGMKIGIIDTGIDYTHAMFGGPGTEDAYKAVNPSLPNPGFPNVKVVGGIDLVGTSYDSLSADPALRIPVPDSNPLDEAGHGTHVAGTVAGIGDGTNTYDGVAPDASLYAIKVFGKKGSTGDAAVIAALEWAADPNADGDLADQLDVVNLSLGGEFGDPHMLYNEAIRNLSVGGTVVVASAGNNGDQSYIVGAPSVTEDALSVAASVDDMDHNWKFRAVSLQTATGREILVDGIEGEISKPISKATAANNGMIIYAGLADQDFDEALKERIKGHVALIDRGIVPFAEKLRRAFEAGAVGMIVANNAPGEVLAMGGEGKWDIPAIMIKQDVGNELKAEINKGYVSIQFNSDRKIEKPLLIDSITDFSSKGPRSMDALMKPEISAPGAQIVSAKMGSGTLGVQFSGTSMAAPHMTGVMALMKQTHPNLTSEELKSIVMGTTKTLLANGKDAYPLSRQGTGRVQIMKALDASLVSSPVAISLGETTIESRKTMIRSLEIKNISKATLTLQMTFETKSNLKISGPTSMTITPGEKQTLSLTITADASTIATSTELEGLIKFISGTNEVLRVPVLMVVNKVSQVKAKSLLIHSTSNADSQGAAIDLTLTNTGVNPGDAYAFNLIGRNDRKADSSNDPFRSRSCDLETVGYRIVKKDGVSTLQFAVKLYEPVTSWDMCEISVLIDADNDGVIDQELVGIRGDHLKLINKATPVSILLDAPKVREIRKKYESDTIAHKKDSKEDYWAAVISVQSMLAAAHSTIAIVEAPINKLKLRPTGDLAVRIATSYQEGSAIMPDDFLEPDEKTWTLISVAEQGAGYTDLPEKITVNAQSTTTASITKGAGSESLIMLYPSNKPVIGGFSKDEQSEKVTPAYKAD